MGMRSFVAPLQNMLISGKRSNSKHWSRKPTSNAKFCIEIWRLVSVSLWINPKRFPVKLLQLSNNFSNLKNIKIISDAGPNKIAAAILNEHNTITHYTKITMNFSDPDNRYQNIREYLGIITCLILLKHTIKTTQPIYVHWLSDSTSAISWAESNKVKSLAGQAANMITIWCGLY